MGWERPVPREAGTVAVPGVHRAAQRPTALSYLDDWARRRRLVVDAALAAALALVLLPTSVALAWGAGSSTPARIALVAAILLGHLTVAARRVRPLAAYTACCLVMLALVVAPDIAGDGASGLTGQAVPPILLPSALVFPVVLYSVTAYSRRPWPLSALAVGLVGASVTAVRLWTASDRIVGPAGPEGLGWGLFVLAALVAIVVASWALGMFRGVRAAYVDALEERAVRAERDRAERIEQAAATERARIAREMHDVVAHSLAVIVRQAEGGRFAADKDPKLAVQALTTVAATGREALADMRTVLGVLREDDARRDDSPQPTVRDVAELVERVRATGLDVDLATSGTPLPLDRATSLAAYRVVQEALTNVVKHAGRDVTVVVRIDWEDDGLRIGVEDDGGAVGSGSGPIGSTGGGQGLVGKRERVAVAGGRLDAGPRKDAEDSGGFAVLARLPSRRHGAPK